MMAPFNLLALVVSLLYAQRLAEGLASHRYFGRGSATVVTGVVMLV